VADLVVELYGTRVGALSGMWRTFDFVPDPAAVARFGIDSTILSVAIPPSRLASSTRTPSDCCAPTAGTLSCTRSFWGARRTQLTALT
jgi:hypothetical protein